MTADAVLRLAHNISSGLVVNKAILQRGVDQTLPYMATENILMAAVAAGIDRQDAHEAIRQHSHIVTANLKAGQERNDLIERLKQDKLFHKVDFQAVLDPRHFIGRAPEQVDEFLVEEIGPILERHGELREQNSELSV